LAQGSQAPSAAPMAQPSYYDGQYSAPAAEGRYGSTSTGLPAAADTGYSFGYGSSQLPPVSAQTTGYGGSQFLDYRGGADLGGSQFLDYRGAGATATGQSAHATDLGYAGSSYASAGAPQAATAPMYTTAATGGSYSMTPGAFDHSNLGYPSAGQSSYSQGAFGAPSFSQGMLQQSTMPQPGSFTAAPQASYQLPTTSYQAAGQDTYHGLPPSGSFVAGGYDAPGSLSAGPMGQFSNPFLAAMYSTLNGQTDPRHWPQFDVPSANLPYAAATRTETRVEPVVRREYDLPAAPAQREERAQDLGGGESLQAEDPTKKLLEAKEKEDKKKRKKEKEEKSGFWFWTCS